MQYPRFQQQGWPIGSGMVESANKNVVEARLKGTGMHWERRNVNPMLALRNAVCNARWQEMWRKAILQHQKQQALHRKDRGEQRAQDFLAVCNPSQMPSPPSPSQLVSETEASSITRQSSVPPVPRSGSSRTERTSGRRATTTSRRSRPASSGRTRPGPPTPPSPDGESYDSTRRVGQMGTPRLAPAMVSRASQHGEVGKRAR